MKQKTSITLSESTLADIDREAGDQLSRSALIEHILRKHFREQRRRERNAHDLAIYNRLADDPAFESDAWEYGVDPLELGDPVEVLPLEVVGTDRGRITVG